VFEDNYDLVAGKWGYHETALTNTLLNQNSGPVNLEISTGYYDDFILNNNWVVSGNASSGMWERAEPVGTFAGSTVYNPEFDLNSDYGDMCFVTGNDGGEPGFDDVDNGKATLTSPVMDLSSYDNPVFSFYSWFANGGGSGTPNDTLTVSITDGVTTVKVANIKNPMSQWVYHEYPVTTYLTPNSTMKVIFSAGDLASSGHIVEAAIDKFEVRNGTSTGIATPSSISDCCFASPNPFVNESSIQYDFGARTFSKASLNVYSVLGQLVETQNIQSSAGTLNWGSQLADGIYLVKVMLDSEVQTVLKVVKTK
ncbi:MAG TPA: T9SS type A sorting domain-containing protein, partial [Chitinophagales bacterium]|nr:T9SS type A sorting domain-containing protein [Chitinophagales bacterium]